MIKLKIKTPIDIEERYKEMMYVIPIEKIRETITTIIEYELQYNMEFDRKEDTMEVLKNLNNLYLILLKQEEVANYKDISIIDIINSTKNVKLISKVDKIKNNFVNYILNTEFRIGLVDTIGIYDEYNKNKYKIEQRG